MKLWVLGIGGLVLAVAFVLAGGGSKNLVLPLMRDKTARFGPLSIESIFSSNHRFPPEADPKDLRTIVVTGDVIPGRGVNVQVLAEKDWLYPWREVVQFLLESDLRVINLEAPLLANCPVYKEGFTFCGDQRHLEGFKFAGIDLVGLENNHILNFGWEGLQETQELLSANRIDWARRDQLAVKEVRGIKFGLLAFNGVGESIDQEDLVHQIQLARPQVDVLLTLFHWGKEYERLPMAGGSIAPDDPQEIAHLAIDSGADLVLGNHPHWFQAVEIYRDHLIAYSHGNFIFDQMWSEETRTGVIGKYTFYKSKLVDVQYAPVKIYNYAQPRMMDAVSAQEELIKMRQASEELYLSSRGGE